MIVSYYCTNPCYFDLLKDCPIHVCFVFAFRWFNSILPIQWRFDLCLVLWSIEWYTNTTHVQNEHVSRLCLVQWSNALDKSFALSMEPLGPGLLARICTTNCIILPSLARCQVLFFLYPCYICFYFLWFQMLHAVTWKHLVQLTILTALRSILELSGPYFVNCDIKVFISSQGFELYDKAQNRVSTFSFSLLL